MYDSHLDNPRCVASLSDRISCSQLQYRILITNYCRSNERKSHHKIYVCQQTSRLPKHCLAARVAYNKALCAGNAVAMRKNSSAYSQRIEQHLDLQGGAAREGTSFAVGRRLNGSETERESGS
jgi:hypothetical protein